MLCIINCTFLDILARGQETFAKRVLLKKYFKSYYPLTFLPCDNVTINRFMVKYF